MNRAVLLLLLTTLAVQPLAPARGQDAPGPAPAEALPAGLRPGPRVDGIQVYLWRLPGEAGELELVAVPGAEAWIARTEVTRHVYAAFCRATDRREPPGGEHADHPVVNVTWEEARAFCAWAGLRLPTRAEWDAAAAGADPARGNFCDASCPEPWEWKEAGRDDGFAYTAPVGSFPGGAARSGALDMAGNAWEWCAEEVPGGGRAARGGGWCSPTVTGTPGFEHAFSAATRWAGLGLRPLLRR